MSDTVSNSCFKSNFGSLILLRDSLRLSAILFMFSFQFDTPTNTNKAAAWNRSFPKKISNIEVFPVQKICRLSIDMWDHLNIFIPIVNI